MVDSSGNTDINLIILEELITAGIEAVEVPKSVGEFEYTIMGKLGDWEFRRDWSYWVASSSEGLPFEVATKLHYKEIDNSIETTNYSKKMPLPKIYGMIVRVAGHCGCPSPEKWSGNNNVTLYHIDSQEGLNELARTIRDSSNIKLNYSLKIKKLLRHYVRHTEESTIPPFLD